MAADICFAVTFNHSACNDNSARNIAAKLKTYFSLKGVEYLWAGTADIHRGGERLMEVYLFIKGLSEMQAGSLEEEFKEAVQSFAQEINIELPKSIRFDDPQNIF